LSLAEWVEALTEILKILAWPAIVVWLVWYLRDEVKRAAGRIIELGLTGAKFAVPPPEQTPAPPKEGVLPTSGPQPETQPEGSNRVQQYIANIRGALSDGLDWAVQGIRADLQRFSSNPAEQIETLVYTVASLNLQIAHERNYSAIYGSQLRLLAQMTPPSAFRPR
jgi:hypothetical protein